MGTQGGNASEVISSGTNYLIVGRTILNAKNDTPTNIEEKLEVNVNKNVGKRRGA